MLAITVATLALEIGGGIVAHSLVLLADAGHLAVDTAGVALSLLAVWAAGRPASESRTFGYQRAEILAAALNALLLLGVGAYILVVGAQRLAHPEVSSPPLMAGIGFTALVAGGVSVWLLQGGEASLNIRALSLEMISHLLSGGAVLLAALVIAATGFQRADALAAIFVVVLIIPRTVKVLGEAFGVLLEGTPRGMDLRAVRDHLLGATGVLDVHDLHVWTISSGSLVLSAHVVVSDEVLAEGGEDPVLDRLCQCLGDHFDLDHCTLQLEPASHRQHEHVGHR